MAMVELNAYTRTFNFPVPCGKLFSMVTRNELCNCYALKEDEINLNIVYCWHSGAF